LKRMGSEEREQSLNLAKLAEQAERFEDMVDCMKGVMNTGLTADELTQEERNLISVGYKNMMSARRSALRNIGSFPDENETQGRLVTLKKEYEATLAAEIDQIIKMVMDDVVAKYTTGPLKATGSDVDSKAVLVFFHKMEGDYYRYGAEIGGDQQDVDQDRLEKREAYKEKAKSAYSKANDASADLAPTNPIKLGLALNQSVFFYEICKEHADAKSLAKSAFDEAIDQLDSLQDQEYKDSTLIMQLLKDNLTLWNENDDDGDLEVQDMEQ